MVQACRGSLAILSWHIGAYLVLWKIHKSWHSVKAGIEVSNQTTHYTSIISLYIWLSIPLHCAHKHFILLVIDRRHITRPTNTSVKQTEDGLFPVSLDEDPDPRDKDWVALDHRSVYPFGRATTVNYREYSAVLSFGDDGIRAFAICATDKCKVMPLQDFNLTRVRNCRHNVLGRANVT